MSVYISCSLVCPGIDLISVEKALELLVGMKERKQGKNVGRKERVNI